MKHRIKDRGRTGIALLAHAIKRTGVNSHILCSAPFPWKSYQAMEEEE